MKKILYAVVCFCLATSLNFSQKRIIESSENELNKIETVGSVISKKLLSTLQAELLKEMRTGNPSSAINLCNIKALPLTNELLNSDQNILTIKRTTEKYRNPLNQPDSLELIALRYFQNNWQKNPETYVQKVEENGAVYFKYYKALGMKGLCISCHGEQSKLDNDVQQKLTELYPNDKATGYKVGDFRGAISITFSSE